MILRLLTIFVALALLSACSSPPTPREQIMSGLETETRQVAILIDVTPAREFYEVHESTIGEGALEGAGAGAAVSLYGGASTGDPLGLVLGVILVPVFATTGAIVGAVSAEPIVHRYSLDEVEGAKPLLEMAATHANLLAFLKEDISRLSETYGGDDIRFFGSDGQADPIADDHTDVQMVIRIDTYALLGDIETDPSVELIVQGVTAVSADWVSDFFFCDWAYSSPNHELSSWSANNAELFITELQTASHAIAEKVVAALRPGSRNCDEPSSVDVYRPSERTAWAYHGLAEAGNAEAQFDLANLSSDQREKYKWMCLAANQRHPTAQYNVGYMSGQPIEAYKWYHLAQLNGYAVPSLYLDRLSQDWTTEQLVEADRLVANWSPDPSQCLTDIELAQFDARDIEASGSPTTAPSDAPALMTETDKAAASDSEDVSAFCKNKSYRSNFDCSPGSNYFWQ